MRQLALLISLLFAMPAAAADPAAILAANRAAMGGEAWTGKAALELDYAYSGQGMTGTTSSLFELAHGHFVNTYDIGPAKGANGFDGVNAWQKDPSGAITLQNGGSALPVAVNEAYRNANLWWRADRAGATIVPDPAKSDRDADAL
ncbi:MAG: hypothetical protein JOZ55_01500, partial [Alphaproteobacteria bacterium]|nr:hypothetical protein [Alphaproteobacteria bacterium]